jgi:hypothetical protein
VLLAFGRPILALYFTKDIQQTHRSVENHEIERKAALDPGTLPKYRLSFAKYYYLDMGESIEYLDQNNKKTIYTPDEKTKDRHEKTKQMYIDMKRINRFIRINGLAHTAMLLLSIPIFLILMRHKKRNSQGSMN